MKQQKSMKVFHKLPWARKNKKVRAYQYSWNTFKNSYKRILMVGENKVVFFNFSKNIFRKSDIHNQKRFLLLFKVKNKNFHVHLFQVWLFFFAKYFPF